MDVLLGPLITFSIISRTKPFKELRRDLVIVGLIQLAALGYGLWTVYAARPVHLVFEIYRFRVVHAIEVPESMLDKAPPGLGTMPMTGPTLLSVRPFKDDKERIDATFTDLGGVPIGTRPDLWQPYEAARAQIIESAKPVSELKARLPAQAAVIDAAVADTRRAPDTLAYVPLVGRKNFWTVLIDRANAQVVGFIPVDPF